MSMIFTSGISKEIEQYINDNMRYDPNTGQLWWTCEGGFHRDTTKPIGSFNGRGYFQVTTPYCNLRVHQICWYFIYCEWPSMLVDHVDNDRTNNKPDNLRLATLSQNSGNSNPHKDGSSKYKGVCWAEANGRWLARCRSKYIGLFESEEEAALAYNYEAEKAFGPFAKYNQVFHDV